MLLKDLKDAWVPRPHHSPHLIQQFDPNRARQSQEGDGGQPSNSLSCSSGADMAPLLEQIKCAL